MSADEDGPVTGRSEAARVHGRGVRIQWCAHIKAYVVTSMPFVDGLAWKVEGCESADLVALVDALWRLYGKFIMAGEFSIDDYVWHRLTSDEIRAIEVLLGDSRAG